MTQSALTPEPRVSRAPSSTAPPGTQITARSTLTGSSRDRRVAGDTADRVAAAVDGIDRADEVGGQDVPEQLPADRSAAGRGSDHGDRGRCEERLQRSSDRDVIATVGDRRRCRSGRGGRPRSRRPAACERSRTRLRRTRGASRRSVAAPPRRARRCRPRQHALRDARAAECRFRGRVARPRPRMRPLLDAGRASRTYVASATGPHATIRDRRARRAASHASASRSRVRPQPSSSRRSSCRGSGDTGCRTRGRRRSRSGRPRPRRSGPASAESSRRGERRLRPSARVGPGSGHRSPP